MPGGPSRKRLPAAERRETILRAAAEVFAASGYRAAKVSDVATRVGVTEPVVFQNFGSKAALFAAVIERAAADVRSALDAVPAPSGGQAAGLLAHVLAAGAHGHAPDHGGLPDAGAGYAVLFSDATELATDPEAAAPARAALRAVAAHLADLIRHDGSAPPGTDPEAAAWLLLSVLATRRLRAAAMPSHLEPDVTALLRTALTASPHPPSA